MGKNAYGDNKEQSFCNPQSWPLRYRAITSADVKPVFKNSFENIPRKSIIFDAASKSWSLLKQNRVWFRGLNSDSWRRTIQ